MLPVFRRFVVAALSVAVVSGAALARDGASTSGAKSKDSASVLAAIAERYFQDYLTLNPLTGSSTLGDVRFEDKLEISIAPAHRARSKALYQRTQRELAGLDASKLNDADALTVALLREETGRRLEAFIYPFHLLPVDQYGGLAMELAQFGNGQGIQPLRTVKNFENYLKRLNKLPAWIDQAIVNMQEGVRTGVVMPRPLIESALPSLREMTAKEIEKSVFYSAIKIMPEGFSARDRKRLTAAYTDATRRRLQPAMAKLVAFLETRYLPACRTSAGIDALPNGTAWYAFQVRSQTTTSMTPDEIHALGQKEVARIRAEMEKIKAHYKFDGDVTAFLKWHFDQPQFRLVLGIVLLAHHYWDLGQAGEFGGAVTAFAGEDFVAHLALHHHDRLQHAVQTQAGGEFLQCLGVEVGAWVGGWRDDQAEIDLQVTLGLLPADGLGEHVAQAAAEAVIA